MTTSNHFETFNVRFTGKNYSAWEFQFQLFVTGKELWGHVDGSDPAPTDSKELLQWNVKDAQVMTWILGSVDPLIVPNLRPYNTAKARESSPSRNIFFGFQNLWAEFIDIVYAKVLAESLSVIQAIHEQSKRDQFLMKLRYDFETIRSNLMSRDPSPSLDVCFAELLREEQHLLTQSTFKQENTVTVAFAAQGKGKGRDMNNIQCYSYKEYGHIAANCGKKFCNYCKQLGHIIKECPTHPQNRRANASSAAMNSSNHFAAPAISTTPSTAAEPFVLTPEMVQQMIVSAFSALGLQGNDIASSQFWLVDSAASNHITNSSSMLKNVRKYHGSTEIQIANGSNIPITKVGDLTPSFKNIFVSPKLSTKLISVGQLVDNNCDVHFSRNSCLVQDQDLPSLPNRFKPGFVYERRQPTLLLPESDPPPAPASEPTSEISFELAPPEPILR
ncbi:hypothetical protein GH714_037968 [Hevea brasiliensis]|uniref:CCHC-type domain-containing protein n=1 Tax=Hevea brasiliensis TaxID=3981 RepID=A0A6A6K8F7_HEVBR|nr:hypothetical protein GH714_037968 [Hevea brasiliensis]